MKATLYVYMYRCVHVLLNSPMFLSMFAGTPLSEKDSDALHKLLQDAKVKLPSSQLTFDKAQQLLHEKGHNDLATNLRARLDEGTYLW